MNILAIETSCDETSAAIVKNGKTVLSNVVSSQVEFHKKYGGVVPEIASRKHAEIVNAVIHEALKKAKLSFKKIDAVAVTYGPGLVGSLLVGVCAAKAISYSLKIPLIPVNHLEGHIYAAFIGGQKFTFPFICLMVSGGHTMLVDVQGHGKYKVLGRTRDDAAGEAFDKVARFIGLGYPGGPIIDKTARVGNPKAIDFPRGMLKQGLDFSFSGIKTAVVNYVNKLGHKPSKKEIPDIAASFQEAVVDVLVEKAIVAVKQKKRKTLVLAGGVSANSSLREKIQERCKKEKIKAIIPPLALCTDNAAMIGAAAYFHPKQKPSADYSLEAVANLQL
ncbi:MAG: tRNA (adenosine(37)-N6)-threonylcarbamoyltransferase complex transferase subunit TsaD [Candidatus Margulisbacteria bacterium]|nr:tRNA (adenosine(37)-N6)-threonylcarbamoyltransferase complex transferase subunit TsaD [Candidatus Margulisiibacteriota bacterium]MBU1022308.1 tRNA (adenosine(37)-N6)-threonylcarbamoyltransferase complex transferase subunit TsaD [Candidatus Margulisiibacteriota bacterium]MBU1729921.1 tRNA (adenosine(37)-N6)-threonylcarbamoyltransferase complex transferase subunit TsaD [Candidatus Margulisiibacteriota bacterium]MBU1955954.1 tRNA (adenosine(37)-N6)-threonylcarbamoyltransferase complex transferas